MDPMRWLPTPQLHMLKAPLHCGNLKVGQERTPLTGIHTRSETPVFPHFIVLSAPGGCDPGNGHTHVLAHAAAPSAC